MEAVDDARNNTREESMALLLWASLISAIGPCYVNIFQGGLWLR